MALPLPLDFMQTYYPNSTRTTVESGKLVVSPYWSIDITCPTGTHVFAVLDGTISKIAVDSGNKYILLNAHHNGDEVVVAYEHLSDTTLVSVGDEVSEGEVIAYSGASGTSVAHLTIGANFDHRYQELSSHRQPSKTVFPPDSLRLRNPPRGPSVPSPSKTDFEAYREAVGLRNWV